MTDTDREAFEAWWRASKYCQVVNAGKAHEQTAWDAWQAATQRQESRIAELEADAALGRQMREAIGNESLARFIEKHGEPVPIMKRVAELEAEVQALRKDAERYKWLRSVPNGFKAQRIVNDTPHGMDAAIDAAMNKEGVRD